MAARRRVEMPGAVRAIWGALLTCLNVLMLAYVVVFITAFASAFTGGLFGTGPGAWLFEGGNFGLFFGVVASMVALSFAFLGLSLVHIVAWSGLPDDQKVVWAAVVFAGAQPGMLAYWVVNVRARPSVADRAARPVIVDTTERRVRLVLLAVLTALPAVYFAMFFGFVLTGIAGGFGSSVPTVALEAIPFVHLGVIVLMWVLTAVYLIDVLRTPRLHGWQRALWAAIVALAGPIGWAVYWFMVMWRQPSGRPDVSLAEPSS